MNLFCCLTTKSLDVDRDVSTAYCKSSSGYCFRVPWFPQALADLPCVAGFDVFWC